MLKCTLDRAADSLSIGILTFHDKERDFWHCPKSDVPISEYLTVNQETGPLGDPVVEQHGGLVGFVSLPIYSGRARKFRLLIDFGD